MNTHTVFKKKVQKSAMIPTYANKRPEIFSLF